jgi:hypothetical protein
VRNIADAVDRFRVLNLAFVDAYLPADYRDELLDGLIELPADLTLFTEMRCDLTQPTAKRLAARGSRIQLGVESFSSAILSRIGKGVRSAHAVYAVRIAQEHGIRTQYNLMTRIPGVTRSEIQELCELLPSLFGLTPPSLTEFYLDRNSLTFADPESHGIAVESLDAVAPPWLARCLGDSHISQVVPFATATSETDDQWLAIKPLVDQWERAWGHARATQLSAPLTWRNGDGWASVVDVRQDPGAVYLLDGVLYDVFLACVEVISEHALSQRLPHHGAENIAAAVAELALRRLVLRDGKLLISLPVRVTRPM